MLTQDRYKDLPFNQDSTLPFTEAEGDSTWKMEKIRQGVNNR